MKSYPAKIFYCYSHKDEELRDRLEVHLKMLERQNLIKSWHDRKIVSGKNWANEISKKLEDSDIVLLLLSSDFLASDYCYEIEMKKAIEMHKSNNIKIVPIILRVCDWKNSPFSEFQGLPIDMTPVLSQEWHTIDEAFHNITEGLKELIQELFDYTTDSIDSSQKTQVLVETKLVDVELTINKDFNSFTLKDQRKIISSIENFLRLNQPIVIKTKREGSVILKFELEYENALKLKYALDDKIFENQGFQKLEFKENICNTEENLDKFLELDFLELRKAVLVLRALNHKFRQRMLPFIYKLEKVTITDIYNKLKIKHSIASQHVAILRRAGIVIYERKGKDIYYSIDPNKIKDVANAIKLLYGNNIDT